ncbi:hypothetical protein HS5_03660 [Acidianus sp. HS-5]|nr:hypothetical protein HS5_03660 [Acidianus sp. HS-5]
MMPFTSYKISSYINCIKHHFDEQTAHSIAFLLSLKLKENIEGFYVADGGVYYMDFINVPVEENCSEIIKIAKGYSPKEVKSFASKVFLEAKYKRYVNYNEKEAELRKIVFG